MDTKRLGLHSMHVDGDTFFLQWVGDFAPEQVNQLHVHMEEMFAEHDRIFLLVDATKARSMGPEARRLAVGWPHLHRLGGATLFGASLTIRTLVTLALAIRKRLFPQGGAVPAVALVATEQAARAFIDARRREILFAASRHSSGEPTVTGSP